MNNPKMSIVIPTCNRREMAEKCLNSLFNQTYPENRYEIIIIDDGSTDDTEKLIKQFQPMHQSLYYLKQANQGPAVARNMGVKYASGEIVVFTDDDCIAPNNFLETIANCFYKYPDISVCAGDRILEFEDKLFSDLSDFCKVLRGGKKDIIFSHLTPLCEMITDCCAIKKDVFLELGGFDSEFFWAAGEDVALGFKILKKGYKICSTSNTFVYHYQRGTVKDLMIRFYRFGRVGALNIDKYFGHRLIVHFPFAKLLTFSRFPFTCYLCINSFKILTFLVMLVFFYPKMALILIILYFLRGCMILKKKGANPTTFFQYTLYRYLLEASSFAGNIVSSVKNRIFCV